MLMAQVPGAWPLNLPDKLAAIAASNKWSNPDKIITGTVVLESFNFIAKENNA